MQKDEVFKEREKHIADFAFGKKVATVFDDMLVRSVPMYLESQRMIAEMATDFAVEGTNIYDLGCSTGTTLLNLDSTVPRRVGSICDTAAATAATRSSTALPTLFNASSTAGGN